MSDPTLPLIVEPDLLELHLNQDSLLIIDLCKESSYQSAHIPGAIYLDYGQIVLNRKPVFGLLPDASSFCQLLASLGITPDTHVVAYDDEGGGKAARLLYTLETIGHPHYSLLNGGLHAWSNEGHALESEQIKSVTAEYPDRPFTQAIADQHYIESQLNSGQLALLDARSVDEYRGVKRFAEKGGHIPGAVNMEWTLAMDQSRNLRLLPASELRKMLEGLGITPEHEVIVYCHSHHRSAHTYIMLKSLGYPNIKGYPGSWSEWGNLPNTPVEV